MSDHRFGRLQPRALAQGDDEDDRPLLDGESQPTSPAMPNPPWQHQHPWPTLQPRRMSHDDFSLHDPQDPLTYERAAGVDAIAHRLSIQHLRPDHQRPPSASRAAMAPWLASPSVVESPPGVAEATPPSTDTLEPPRVDRCDAPRHEASALHEDDRRWRMNSSKFHNTIQSTRATQTLVEGLACTRAQCDVLGLPAEPPADLDAQDGTKMEVDPTGVRADDDLGHDAEFEKSLVEQLAEARHGGGTLGTRRFGFPLYRSSTETALRCQNLVRNKPRMRKRTKLRDKPRQSAMSAAAGSSVASGSSAS